MASEKDVQQLATQVACSIFEKELNLRKAFAKFDTDGDGSISKKEFADTLGQSVSDAIFDIFDASQDGKISTREFQDSLLDYGGGAAAPPPKSRSSGGGGGGGGSSGGGGGHVQFASTHAEPQSSPAKSARAESPRVKAARHVEAIQAADNYTYEEEEVDGETMTDAEVMDLLSDRLEEEGVPLHRLFKILCKGGSQGTMDVAGLRSVIEKMGLGYTLASLQEERAAAATKGAASSSAASQFNTPGFDGGFAATRPHTASQRPGTALQDGSGTAVETKIGHSSGLQAAEGALRTGAADDESMLTLLPLIKKKCYERGFETGEVGKLWLALSPDRRHRITPRHFFEKLGEWGVPMTVEQCCKLLDPFDVDFNGTLDFNEFAAWVALWDPPDDGDSFSNSWRRGGPTDRRVWGASGAGSGRIGRLFRLMQMIDADHNGEIAVFEFVRALARGDDYDHAVGGGGGGEFRGRLNPDGTLKQRGPTKAELDAAAALEREKEVARLRAEADAALAAQEARLGAALAAQEARFKAEAEAANRAAADFDAKMRAEAEAALAARQAAARAAEAEEARRRATVEAEAAAARLLQRIATGLRAKKDCNRQFTGALKRVKDGELAGPEDLRAAMSGAGLYHAEDAADALCLFQVHGRYEEGVSGARPMLPVWKLLKLLSECGGQEDENEEEEEIQAVPVRPPPPRKKVVVKDPFAEEKRAEAELLAAAKAQRLNPDYASMDPEQLRRVQMNDNAMIQQLRTELNERSRKMKDMFRRMDVTGNGTISLLEFRKGLQRSGFHDGNGMHLSGLDRDALDVSVEDTVRLFNYFDTNGDGTISYAEFMRLLQNTVQVDYRALTVGENTGVVFSGSATGVC